jgi:hypothetical protein
LTDVHPALLLGSAVVFVAERKGIHPIALIVTAATAGATSSLL